MPNQIFKYSAVTLLVIIAGYNSVSIRNLSASLAEKNKVAFDAKIYAEQYWKNALMPAVQNAIELDSLILNLKSNPTQTFERYSHAVGIGNIRYFLVKGTGVVASVGENSLIIKTANETLASHIQIETEFIYGNAVRDAVGSISLNEFKSTADLNQVSQELNKFIRAEVVPPFVKKVKVGDVIQFGGAIELNQKYFTLTKAEIIPVLLTIQSH